MEFVRATTHATGNNKQTSPARKLPAYRPLVPAAGARSARVRHSCAPVRRACAIRRWMNSATQWRQASGGRPQLWLVQRGSARLRSWRASLHRRRYRSRCRTPFRRATPTPDRTLPGRPWRDTAMSNLAVLACMQFTRVCRLRPRQSISCTRLPSFRWERPSLRSVQRYSAHDFEVVRTYRHLPGMPAFL